MRGYSVEIFRLNCFSFFFHFAFIFYSVDGYQVDDGKKANNRTDRMSDL